MARATQRLRPNGIHPQSCEHFASGYHRSSGDLSMQTQAALKPRPETSKGTSPPPAPQTHTVWEASPEPELALPSRAPRAGNQAHMARPALFVLASRRSYLRRFLSPRNQQNPKPSLAR